jgi:hypothetical protein
VFTCVSQRCQVLRAPYEQAARVGSPSTVLAIPLASGLAPGSPSRLAAPSLLQWPAASHLRPGGEEASPGGAASVPEHGDGNLGASDASITGGNGASAVAPVLIPGSAGAVTLPPGQLSASLAAVAAGDGAAPGVMLPVRAVPSQPMAVGGTSDPPRPPPPAGSAAGSANHVTAAQEAGAAPAAAPAHSRATGNSALAGAAPASVGDWADFGAAFAEPNTAQTAQAGATPSQQSPSSPPPRRQADAELLLEDSQELSPFKRTGSLRAHDFWALEDAPASETDSDRDD